MKTIIRQLVFLGIVLCVMLPVWSFAQTPPAPDTLNSKDALQPVPDTATPSEEPEEKEFKLPAPQVYGFVRLQTWFNDSAVFNIDAPLWIIPNGNKAGLLNQDGDFGLSARESRVGIKWGFDILKAKFSAKLEGDFWGGFVNSLRAANQPDFRLRVAAVAMDWGVFHFKMANDWSIASPMNPGTISFIILGGQGNLWMRTPYINIGSAIPLGKEVNTLHFDVAAARAEAGDSGTEGPRSQYFDGAGVGESAKMPHLHYRAALKLDKAFEIGFSGIFGRELAKGNATDTLVNEFVNSYFFSGELKVAGGPVTFSGEFFYGANINQFLGNIVTGSIYHEVDTVNSTVEDKPIPTLGGWGNLNLKIPKTTLEINAGGGFEKILEPGWLAQSPTVGSKANSGAESQISVYMNLWINLFKNYKIGFEGQYIRANFTWEDSSASDFQPSDNFRLAFCSHFSF